MRNLRIAFIVRSTIDKVVGGDSQQVKNTAHELRKLGVKVDVILSNQKVDYQRYDLLHLFNIIRPADHLIHIEKSNKPTVVSTIYLDYCDFDNYGRGNLQKKLFKLVGKDGAEYLKNNYRFLKKQDRLVSSEYLWGHRKAIKKIISKVRLLLPNSKSEYLRFSRDYKISLPYHVVPNGINKEVFGNIPNVDRISNQIVSVGQIYGLKNQHHLIEASAGLDVNLVLIGKSPPNHTKYYDLCKKLANDKVTFYDFMPQERLLEHYAKSKVHALPSWFETTGLSSLEAGSMGCNLVVGAGGDTSDYFSKHASFCSASDVESIKKALEKELSRDNDLSFRDIILSNYTWEKAAKETLVGYKKALEIG